MVVGTHSLQSLAIERYDFTAPPMALRKRYELDYPRPVYKVLTQYTVGSGKSTLVYVRFWLFRAVQEIH